MNESELKQFELLKQLLPICHTYNHIKRHILKQSPLALSYADRQLLGTNLKLARIKAGYSQSQIAKHLSLSAQAISSYECGTHYPSYQYLHTLCIKYKISFPDLFLSLESLPDDHVQLLKKLENIDVEFHHIIDLLICIKKEPCSTGHGS